jgi:hypothetical protein
MKPFNKSETFLNNYIVFFFRALQRIAYDSQAPEATKATTQSEAADLMAQSALNSIEDILHDLPKQVDQARKLPRGVEDTNKVASQVATFLKSDVIINDDEQDATILDLFISSLLYMFRAIPSPIIRST